MTRRQRSFREKLGNAVLVVVLLPFVLPLALLAVTLALLHRATLWLLVQLLWLPRGKDVLLVYSDSPIWHDYMVNEIAPLVAERAVVLNWSERRQWHWWSLAVHVFRSYGGGREFNPLVLLFHPLRRARIFRLWPAFQDWKRGYPEPLERAKQEILTAL
jgi:hypothetical protein